LLKYYDYLLIKSRDSSLAFGKNYTNYYFLESSSVSKTSVAKGLSKDSTSSGFGWPSN